MLYNQCIPMKYILYLILVVVFFYGATPYNAAAATSTNQAAQIESLKKLLVQLQVRLAILTAKNTATATIPTLTYERKTNYVDENINRFGVTLLYSGPTSCSATAKKYRVYFGDGTSAPADCKGVVDHIYKRSGTYTAKYTENGTVIAKVKIVLDGSTPKPTLTIPAPLYDSPAITATMNVVSTGNRSIKVTGVITPPKNCVGTEQMEVQLRFTDENMVSYTLSTCKPREFEMSTTYDTSSLNFFPELRTRWVDATNNTWTYTDLVRYRVDFSLSDDTPQIIKLGAASKG